MAKYCQAHGKLGYKKKKLALQRKRAAEIHHKSELEIYKCYICHHWHLTTKQKPRR